MPVIYGPEQRKQISDEAKGKIIESLDYVEEDNYWAMSFTDGTEIAFRFMAELVQGSEMYVSAKHGKDRNPGTAKKPKRTILGAIQALPIDIPERMARK